jgi:4-amino-4-deoxy-L-arabinose transferase-like glycosyltransferase
MSRRRLLVWFSVIFALAAMARLAATFALKRWDDPAAGANRQLAVNLVEYGALYFREFGYFGPSSVQTPPYPTMLAGLFALFGVENPTAYFAALSLNAVFGALCAVAVAQLVRRSGGGDAAGVVAGFVVAVWPSQVFASQFVQPMVLIGLLAVVAAALWRRTLWEHDAFAWSAFSVVAALGALLEPTLLPALAAALVAVPFVGRWAFEIRVRNFVILAGAIAVVWLPWLARNRAVHGQMLVTTRVWQNHWAASNPGATGSDRLPLTSQRRDAAESSLRAALLDDAGAADVVRIPMMQVDQLSPQQRFELQGRPEVRREAIFAGWTAVLVESGESRWVAQLPIRLAKAWTIDWDHPMSRHALAMIPRWTAAILAAGALALLLARREASAGALAVVLLSSVIAQGLTIASARQVIALEPLQIALAATGIAVAARQWLGAPRRLKLTSVAHPAREGLR